MARSRNIKPAFFANDDLADLNPLTRLLFVGLWTVADRNGVLEDKPRKVKAQVLPYDDADVEAMLDQLVTAGFLKRFQVKGQSYLHIPSFEKHQNPHRGEKVLYPAPDQHDASTVSAPDKYGASTVLAPDQHSASPDESGKMNDESGKMNEDGRGPANPPPPADDDPELPEEQGPTPDEILDAWNEAMGAKARMTKKRRASIKTRLADSWWRDNWQEALLKARGSPFLTGDNDRGWKADLDFFLKPDTVTKISEGKYDGKRKPASNGRGITPGAREYAAETL